MLKNLKIIQKPKKGKCRIIEDGKSCHREFAWRGLCCTHYQRVNKQGKLKKFALSSQYRTFNEDDYEIAKRHKKGFCRIKEKGKLCKVIVEARGLCKQHYDILRNNVDIDDYGLPSQLIKNYTYNPHAKEDTCPILEDGKSCKKKIFGRGLCQKHRQYYYRHHELEEVGTESRTGCYFNGTSRMGESQKYKK